MTIRTLTPAGPMDSGHTAFLPKPWGWERLLIQTDAYAAKFLFLAAGQRTSRQHHVWKTETLIVLDGTLTVEGAALRGLSEFRGSWARCIVAPREVLHIPAGAVHQLIADRGDVLLVEVSTPELDDVVRVEDPHGR